MYHSDFIYTSCHGIKYHGMQEVEIESVIPKWFYMGLWRIATVFLADVNDSDAEVYTNNYPSRFVFLLRDEDGLVGLANWMKDEDFLPGASVILSIPDSYFTYQGINPSGAPFLQCSDPDSVVVGADEDEEE